MLRVNWNYIKIIVLLGLVIFLFAFASDRNANREVSNPNIKFIGERNLFITHETVSKLLIQNYEDPEKVPKEILALNTLEKVLKSNPMIKTAELYLAVNGDLSVEVEQKTPIARVLSDMSYYIDEDGVFMPLSENYSERVPLVTGYVKKNDFDGVYEIAKKVRADEFLMKNVYEIHQDINSKFSLRFRKCNFLVELGKAKYLDKKINNLKAFYKKNLIDETLNDYIKVNLQFENQVIGTKKIDYGT